MIQNEYLFFNRCTLKLIILYIIPFLSNQFEMNVYESTSNKFSLFVYGDRLLEFFLENSNPLMIM